MGWFNRILWCRVKERMSIINLGFWYRSSVAIGCTVVIGVMTLVPKERMPNPSAGGIPEPDHIVAYVFLMIFCLLAWGKRLPPILIAIGVIGYGCITEFLQYGIPGRDPEWLDVVANSIGVLLGWVLMMALQGFVRGKA